MGDMSLDCRVPPGYLKYLSIRFAKKTPVVGGQEGQEREKRILSDGIRELERAIASLIGKIATIEQHSEGALEKMGID